MIILRGAYKGMSLQLGWTYEVAPEEVGVGVRPALVRGDQVRSHLSPLSIKQGPQ